MAGSAVLTIPDSALKLERVRRNGARQRDHEADHQLCDCVRIRTGKIDDRDAALVRGRMIDIVRATRPLCDELEPRRAIDHPSRHAIE